MSGFDFDTDTLSYDEWWAEHDANRCCPSAEHARRSLCGCGGPASLTHVSRLLTGEPDF